MRFNAHCHVFNLQSVFTKGTRDILASRLKGLPKPLSDLILGLLDRFMDRPAGFGAAGAGGPGLAALAADAAFTDNMDLLPIEARQALDLALGGKRVGIGQARGIFSEILQGSENWDAANIGVEDFAEFLRVALAADMDLVTDHLFEEMDAALGDEPGDRIIAPLMMDILSEAPTREELAVFERQKAGTMRQMWRRPGLALPFYAIHPSRPDVVARMKTALENEGFVGVKLYPSLGYQVSLPLLDDVYAYCAANDAPLLMHCNNGGFKASDAYADYCNPLHWRPILARHEKLKICFGHFGGELFFIRSPDNPHAVWNQTITNLMTEFPGRVYADLSFNTGGMENRGVRWSYFYHLGSILAEKAFRPYVLWGTDYFLVLQRVREKNYWRYFRRHIDDEAVFTALTRDNPMRFLGMDATAPVSGSTRNIRRHAAFLRNRPAGAPAPIKEAEWLSDQPIG